MNDSKVEKKLKEIGPEFLECPHRSEPSAGYVVPKEGKLAERIERLLREEG